MKIIKTSKSSAQDNTIIAKVTTESPVVNEEKKSFFDVFKQFLLVGGDLV